MIPFFDVRHCEGQLVQQRSFGARYSPTRGQVKPQLIVSSAESMVRPYLAQLVQRTGWTRPLLSWTLISIPQLLLLTMWIQFNAAPK